MSHSKLTTMTIAFKITTRSRRASPHSSLKPASGDALAHFTKSNCLTRMTGRVCGLSRAAGMPPTFGLCVACDLNPRSSSTQAPRHQAPPATDWAALQQVLCHAPRVARRGSRLPRLQIAEGNVCHNSHAITNRLCCVCLATSAAATHVGWSRHAAPSTHCSTSTMRCPHLLATRHEICTRPPLPCGPSCLWSNVFQQLPL